MRKNYIHKFNLTTYKTTQLSDQIVAITDNDRTLLDNWGNRYIPPFAVQIGDDEDDALRRRKRRGIGR